MAPGKKEKGKALAEPSSTVAKTEAILEDIPKPVASFDIGDTQNIETNYSEFVKKITNTLQNDTDVKFNFTGENGERCVPVTPGSDQSASGIFVFEIKDDETRLRVVCQKYQMWFRGIVATDEGRYEIDVMEPRVMAGSKSLHTDGMYPNLTGDGVHICKVGFQSLHSAVHELANHKLGVNHKAAIAVILVMFFEAARLKELFDLCFRLLKDKNDEQVGKKNKDLINNWYHTSWDFYCKNRDEQEIFITSNTSASIRNIYDNVTVLCRSAWDHWVEKNMEQVKTHKYKPRKPKLESTSHSRK